MSPARLASLTRFAVAAMLLSGLVSAQATSIGPQQLVEQTANRMLATLRANQAALNAKPDLIYGLVNEIVLPHFDFVTMARWVLGKYWREADRDQKRRFVLAFRNFMVRTYAVALLEFADYEIRFFPLRDDLARGDVTVRSEVKRKGKPAVTINYSLHLSHDAWKVYDISVDGVSLVTSQRTSFASEIRQSGIDALILKLEKPIDKSKKSQP